MAMETGALPADPGGDDADKCFDIRSLDVLAWGSCGVSIVRLDENDIDPDDDPKDTCTCGAADVFVLAAETLADQTHPGATAASSSCTAMGSLTLC